MTKTDQILEVTQDTAIKVAKIEEHLKNLNGSVVRHETNINELYTKTNDNRLNLGKERAKTATFGAMAGAMVAGVIAFLTKFWR